MKTYFAFAVLCSLFLSVSCVRAFLADDLRLAAKLPEPPGSWKAVLGSPHWRVEWFDGEGRKRSATVAGTGGPEISLPGTSASPVLALPFWPEKGIAPGVFRPAGAISPFDVSGGKLALSWQGGVDATLFIELARSADRESPGQGTPRLPQNFNWPRFRGLFDDPENAAGINAQVHADPWLADWSGIAQRAVQSGFDRRRLVPEARSGLELPPWLGPGPWVGASPFAAPLVFEESPVFQVRSSAADTWVSAEWILRANAETRILLELPAKEGRAR